MFNKVQLNTFMKEQTMLKSKQLATLSEYELLWV